MAGEGGDRRKTSGITPEGERPNNVTLRGEMMTKLIHRYICVFSTILLIALSMAVQVEAARAFPDTRDSETRSVIVSADGFAVPEEGKSLEAARRGAWAEARRKILEKARKYLDEVTRVEGVKLAVTFEKTASKGFVSDLERTDYGIDEEGRYHVWLKGEVRYSLSNDEACREALLMPSAPLTIALWTDKRDYKEGETVTVFFRGNRDFYGKILLRDTAGTIVQILPNNYRQISFFEKGKTYTVPGEGDRCDMRVHPPFGTETFSVCASDAALSLRNMKTIAGGVYQYRGRPQSFEKSVRSGLPVIDNSPAEFYEATWVIVKKPG